MFRSFTKWIYRIISIAVVTGCAVLPLTSALFSELLNSHQGISAWCGRILPWFLIALYILINVFPSVYNKKYILDRHRILADGAELLIIFMVSLLFTVSLAIWMYAGIGSSVISSTVSGTEILSGILMIPCAIIVLSIVFWNGIIRVYMTSVQLGIKHRIWGIALGWLFPANLVMLGIIVRIVTDEVQVENERIILNRSRAQDGICRTRYPLLMVHGVFFRDSRQGFLNYWGRIPDDLITNGAVIFYGNQQSAASVAKCGEELATRIRQIVAETGCGKVNIIAHSKGGLDSRYAVSKCGVSDMVASITTINTPHRGCEFADYLLNKIPGSVQARVAGTYNSTLKRLGDHDPDFMEAVTDLTFSACAQMNTEVTDVPGVFYQSFGSHIKKASGGRFPLNFSFQLVKYFDGPNDGLVGEKSFPWGEAYRYLESSGSRGISHGDMIDLNRENFAGFDVREFYVQLVNDLKRRGF